MSEQRRKSKYAEKRDRGDQMYGPGCCAHKVTLSQVNAAKDAAKASGHKFWSPTWNDRRHSH